MLLAESLSSTFSIVQINAANLCSSRVFSPLCTLRDTYFYSYFICYFIVRLVTKEFDDCTKAGLADSVCFNFLNPTYRE